MSPTAKNSLLMLLMFAVALASVLLKPVPDAAQHKRIGLETMIPEQFGGWREVKNVAPVMPASQQAELLEMIYDETLARTYVNDRREQVMLSIAYGGDQSGRLKVHRPEACYTGQGFMVKHVGESLWQTSWGSIPVKLLIAEAHGRHEPVSYWIRVGESAVTGVWGQRMTQMAYSLVGEIPDGLIFRVSSIDADQQRAFQVQERFVSDLMDALSPADRRVLAGALLKPTTVARP